MIDAVAIDQVAVVVHRVADLVHRDRRRDLAGGVAAHAVGDHEQPELLVDEEVVLVVRVAADRRRSRPRTSAPSHPGNTRRGHEPSNLRQRLRSSCGSVRARRGRELGLDERAGQRRQVVESARRSGRRRRRSESRVTPDVARRLDPRRASSRRAGRGRPQSARRSTSQLRRPRVDQLVGGHPRACRLFASA